MRFAAKVALAVGLASLSPLTARAETAPVTDAAPTVKEKKICKRESSVGSNMVKKICHTAAEWRAIEGTERRSVTERDRSSER